MRYIIAAIIFLLFIVFVLLLCGCSSTSPKVVNMPIPLPAANIKLPPKPKLPIWSLTPKSGPAEVAKAYVASVQLLNQDDDALRAAWIAAH